jgi:hypothetical protein
MWRLEEAKTSRQRLDKDVLSTKILDNSVLAGVVVTVIPGVVWLISSFSVRGWNQASVPMAIALNLALVTLGSAIKMRNDLLVSDLKYVGQGKEVLKELIKLNQVICGWKNKGFEKLNDFELIIDKYEQVLEHALNWEKIYHEQKKLKSRRKRMSKWRKLSQGLNEIEQDYTELSWGVGLLTVVYDGRIDEINMGKARRNYAGEKVESLNQLGREWWSFQQMSDYNTLVRIADGREDLYSWDVFKINDLYNKIRGD